MLAASYYKEFFSKFELEPARKVGKWQQLGQQLLKTEAAESGSAKVSVTLLCASRNARQFPEV